MSDLDANTRPYFITDAETGSIVPVHFAPLLAEDAAELKNEDWSQAIFALNWLQLVGSKRVLKLIADDTEDQRIQGILHLGEVEPNDIFLMNSLLEAAPFNQHWYTRRAYHGVGRVLVARLVAKSILLGGQGRVLVQARPGTEDFYKALGFKSV